MEGEISGEAQFVPGSLEQMT
ncbi:hypothetical protein PT2222_570006 [Paraburkholderia tropica]